CQRPFIKGRPRESCWRRRSARSSGSCCGWTGSRSCWRCRRYRSRTGTACGPIPTSTWNSTRAPAWSKRARAVEMRAVRPWLWVLPAGALVVPFFFLPVAFLLRNSVYRDDPTRFLVPDFTFANYVTVLTDTYYLKVFANSLILASLVSGLALVLAY